MSGMFIVGYPKSGNTWLSYLLAYCLNAEFDDYDEPGIHPRNEYIRKYVKGRMEHTSYQDLIGKINKTHCIHLPEHNDEPVIYLLRDGRDVMVSYFHYEYSYLPTLPLFEKGLTKKLFLWRLKRRVYSWLNKPDFSQYLKMRLPAWVNHVNEWRDKGYTALVCYEDLVASPESTLIDLFKIIGTDVPVSVIRKSIRLFQFDTLSGRRPGNEDTTSFFRKGAPGDWRNYFSDSDLMYFNTLTCNLKDREYCRHE